MVLTALYFRRKIQDLESVIKGKMFSFNKNRHFRRFIILWAMVIVTVFLIWTWIRPPDIPSGTAAVLGAIIGLIATVFSFYQAHRADDERREKEGKRYAE